MCSLLSQVLGKLIVVIKKKVHLDLLELVREGRWGETGASRHQALTRTISHLASIDLQ